MNLWKTTSEFFEDDLKVLEGEPLGFGKRSLGFGIRPRVLEDDPRVLKSLTLPGGRRYLKHNNREDLVLYLEAWACLLEAELPIEPQPSPTDGLVEAVGDSKVA